MEFEKHLFKSRRSVAVFLGKETLVQYRPKTIRLRLGGRERAGSPIVKIFMAIFYDQTLYCLLK